MNNQNDEVVAPVRNRPMALATVMLSSFIFGGLDNSSCCTATYAGAISTPDQISWVITSTWCQQL